MTPKKEDPPADAGNVTSGSGEGRKSDNPDPSEDTKETDAKSGGETEIGGRGGADPTRYGDWEINGRCVDF
ncbi:MAG: DUF1674 domain-containing protein [Alphaproteobacteria bacterium]